MAAKKYAFAADYVRLYALYTEGGIYLDTDVLVPEESPVFISRNPQNVTVVAIRNTRTIPKIAITIGLLFIFIFFLRRSDMYI